MKQEKLSIYQLTELERKTLFYLEKDLYATAIAHKLEYSKSRISQIIKKLEKDGFIQKRGRTKPQFYDVKIDVNNIDDLDPWGAKGGSQMASISLHNSEIQFCILNDFHSQIKQNLSKVESIDCFDCVNEMGGGNWLAFKFFYSGFQFLVYPSSVRVSPVAENYEITVSDIRSYEEDGKFYFKEVEDRMKREAREALKAFISYLRVNGSSLNLRVGEAEFVNKRSGGEGGRHFVLNFPDGFQQRLQENGGLLELPAGVWFDHTPDSGGNLEGDEDFMRAVETAVKVQDRGGVPTKSDLDRVREEIKEDVVGEVREVVESSLDDVKEGLVDDLVERALSEIRDGDGSSKEENDEDVGDEVPGRLYG